MHESEAPQGAANRQDKRAGVDLVTGGQGFVGRHLVQQLERDGRSVRILDLVAPTEPPGPRVEAITGSVTDPTVVARAMQGVERVFHIAGDPNLWRADKAAFDEINHRGTRLVLQEAASANVRAFVHVSSAAILPFGKVTTLQPDSCREGLTADAMPGPYARSKLAAEKAALAAAQGGMPVMIVSPTLPIGADDWHLTPPTAMIRDFVNGRTPAYLDFEVSFIDVRDLARGLIRAADQGKPGHRYVLGRPPIRFSEFLALLGDISGVAMPRRTLPSAFALVVAWVSELIADHVTRRPPRASLEGVRMAAQAIDLPFEDSARALGLELRPLQESLRTAVEWLQASGRRRGPETSSRAAE